MKMKTLSEPAPFVCSECGGRALIWDPDSGEEVCGGCGLVISGYGGDGASLDEALVQGLAVDDRGLLLYRGGCVEPVREPAQLRHGLVQVPVDARLAAAPYLPPP